MVKIKKIPTKLALLSFAIYIILMGVILKSFDILTLAVYLVLGYIISEIANNTMKGLWTMKRMFILGASVALVYNALGIALGWFSASVFTTIWASVQQGILTLLVYKIGGGKR